jgi:hypothetical protein
MEKRPWWGQEGGCEPGPVLLAKYVDHGLSAILGVGFTKNGPGKYLSMDFAEHIRAQHNFRTPDELSNQIAQDCDMAEGS